MLSKPFSILIQFILVLLFVLLSTSVYSDERILDFKSLISIQKDGSMIVEEVITVRSEQNKIKRGIYRDFPTRYKDRYNNHYQVEFNVLSVQRDGSNESYHTKALKNGTRLYLGSQNVFLNKGTYTYTIRYSTNRQLGFFETHDELYWNATGNGWIFPIDKVTAEVQLPSNVPVNNIGIEAYTGWQGSKGQDYQAQLLHDGRAQYVTTRALKANEGLTIVTTWPKGYVTEPELKQNIIWVLNDNKALLIALMGLLLVVVYYYLVWQQVGKDPEAGVIFPHYYPEKGFSPASMRYIRKMGYDHKTFASAIVNLAAKGALEINEYKKKFTLSINRNNKANLAPGEAALINKLFATNSTIKLENKNHQTISKAIKAHKNSLKLDYQKLYFNMNSIWILPGILTSIGFFIAVLITIKNTAGPDTLFALIWLSGWTLGVIVLGKLCFQLWQKALSGQGFLGAVAITLFSIPFFAAEIFVMFEFEISIPLVLSVAALLGSNVLFFHLLKAPTLAGRKLLDKIEGFRLYLDVAEKDEINLKNPPDKTPEIFEIYLAYAMALDVEQHWAEKFTSLFNTMEEEGKTYRPKWYHGSHWNHHRMGGFTKSIGSSLSSAISSSSTAPGSSSGSGGGGSSGGGGGGGGGGGW